MMPSSLIMKLILERGFSKSCVMDSIRRVRSELGRLASDEEVLTSVAYGLGIDVESYFMGRIPRSVVLELV